MVEPNFIKLGMFVMTLYHDAVCLYVYRLSLLGKGSLKILQREKRHAKQKEKLEASFFMWPLYNMKGKYEPNYSHDSFFIIIIVLQTQFICMAL